ncbi:hypothetical protein [Herbaspirillum frisingense]|uniref:hypothetical protein n=1 Tax=Herbaspirillum frisingense TaxID=92645 RepID=UPI000587F27C|nr:hypothetical protein [Herbaspirillum frisingense]
MLADTEIVKARITQSEVEAAALKIHQILSAPFSDLSFGEIVFLPGTEKYDLIMKGYFGMINVRFSFGRTRIGGRIRYAGQYRFLFVEPDGAQRTLTSFKFDSIGRVLDFVELPNLLKLNPENSGHAKSLILNKVIGEWIRSIPSLR